MTQLTDTQSLTLSRAASRPGLVALPLPNRLAGAAARLAVTKMIERGLLEEVPANPRRDDPLWRETGDGQGTTLVATAAGLEAIGIEPEVASAVTEARAGAATDVAGDGAELVSAPPSAPPRITKQAQLIALLQRPEGATIAEIAAATGWLPHTVRGAISGTLKKRLGLTVLSEKREGRGTAHRIPA